MLNNKIQDIADEITAYKPYTLFSLMEKSLKENNAPFPEEIEYYLKKMIKSIGIGINNLNISNVVKNDNKYTFTINTQPFSYLEINDIPQNIKENTMKDNSILSIMCIKLFLIQKHLELSIFFHQGTYQITQII